MRKTLNFTIVLFIISIFTPLKSQTTYIYLNDVRDGKFLERATSTPVNVFLERLMSNGFELEKNPRKWRIVVETANHIFYGILSVAPNGEEMVGSFCKTDVFKVKELFPIFENTDGVNIKAKLYYLYIHNLEQTSIRPECDKRYKLVYEKYKFRFTQKGIEVYMNVSGFCYDEKVLNVKINCLLDQGSLEILEEDNEIKDYIHPENDKTIKSKSKIKNFINDIKLDILK